MKLNNQCVVVLGMHRSGTSSLSGVLSKLGVTPGDALIPAMETVNPLGFWEHAEITRLNDELMEALESSWLSERFLPEQWWLTPQAASFGNRIMAVLRRDFGECAIWLIKDPRMCRLLPMWHRLFAELESHPLFVIALRHPAEVARSLHKRDGISEAASCLLWLAYMLDAEFHTRGRQRVLVAYDQLLSDWRKTVDGIGNALDLAWPVAVEEAARGIDAFLDPSLRHHAGNTGLPDHTACKLAMECFELLSAPAPDAIKLDHLRARAAELADFVAPWSAQFYDGKTLIRDHQATIARLESGNTLLQEEIFGIRNSLSWKITRPLRLVQRKLKLLIPPSNKT